jgi:predicted ATPase
MLLSFQAELQKKEQRIKSFAEICTKYSSQSKECVYDSTSFQFFVRRLRAKKGADNLEIKHLSSGEKQIMSLFSHLYLSDHQTFFVLIDEPELSLSVPWQRQFLLDISQSDFCRGFVAVTHSPFMYDNELKPYAHGLGEFVV